MRGFFQIRMKTMKKMSNNKIKYLKNLFLMLKGVWWMKNSFSLHNKHRDDEVRLEEQKMLYFQRIEADTLSPCFRRLDLLPSLSLPQPLACHHGEQDKNTCYIDSYAFSQRKGYLFYSLKLFEFYRTY